MRITMKAAFAMAAIGLAPVSAEAATLMVGPLAAVGMGPQGTTGNSILTYAVGANAHITAVRHALTLTTVGYSWLNEQVVLFGNSEETRAAWTPGYELAEHGTMTYTGLTDLTAIGLDFFLLGDGLLKLEFTDIYNDGVEGRAFWQDVRLEITYDTGMARVPEPASWALMIVGIGAVGGAARYRRRPMRVTVG